LALLYLALAKIPLSSGLAFQAYLFWPAAALGHTAFLLVGWEAAWSLALGSLLLNSLGWLPWPQALAMALLQTLGPLAAWRLMIQVGCPRPDLRLTRDLLCWLGAATLASAVVSSGLGTLVVGSALPGGHFSQPMATGFSWFLGDLTAILCLGPALLHFGPRFLGFPDPAPSSPSKPPLRSLLAVGLLCLLLLFGGRVNPRLSADFRLALQFALVLPILWMALRFGPRATAAGVALLSLAFLAQLWLSEARLPDEVFRFSQLHLLVLALAALVTSAAAEETRQARLALAARDLQAQRMEAVGTLAGGLVHEFNNQLTVVLGNLDRLRELLPEPGEAAGFARRLEEAALSMGSTVRQLKSLSHQAPLHSYPLPLSEALVPFLYAARELPARLTFHTALEADPVLGLDPDLLNQTLQRLLTNSVEAIPGEGSIRLSARQEGAWVHLALEDTGLGMSPEVLSRACDPFFTTKPLATGRGLGLSIAFALTKQMGGHLLLESQPGRGTRAELVLPVGRALPAPLPPPAGPVRLRRILLADDEAGLRDLTREFLESEGFLVTTAPDGQAALDTFEAAPQDWDLLILDLVMPRLDGLEVLKRIERVRPDLPALLMSGYSTSPQPGVLGAAHRRFLAKPFRLQALLEALRSLGLRDAQDAPP
jgi:signal transduction histidine kinase/ActR/RegA family two-component response regulator